MQLEPPNKLPTIDREKEIKEIEDRIKNLYRGEGGGIFIGGEAGIGKTRLIQEILNKCIKDINTIFVKVRLGEDPLYKIQTKICGFTTGDKKNRELKYVEKNVNLDKITKRYREEGGTIVTVGAGMGGGEPPFKIEISAMGNEIISAKSLEGVGTVLLQIMKYNLGNVLIIWKDLAEMLKLVSKVKLKLILERLEEETTESGSLLLINASKKNMEKINNIKNRKMGERELWTLRFHPLAEEETDLDIVVETLKKSSEKAPILLIIEDLHLASGRFLNTLHYLMRELISFPILILGSYRIESGTPGGSKEVSEILRRASREKLFDRIMLKPLSREDFNKYIAALKPEREIEENEISALYRLSGGNPLLTWEILNVQSKEKRISIEENGEVLGEENVPLGIKTMFLKGLNNLNETQKNVLKALAIYEGSTPILELKEFLPEIDEEKLLDILESLIKMGYIKENERGGVEFVHEIFKENLYETMEQEAREKYHRHLALSLLKRFEEGERGRAADIIKHFKLAGEYEYALSLAIKIASRYFKKREHSKSIKVLEILLKDTPRVSFSKKQWLTASYLYSYSLYEVGKQKESMIWVERVIDGSASIGWARGNLKGTILKAYILKDFAKYDEALLLLTRALGQLENLQEEKETALEVYFQLGELLFHQGELKASKETLVTYLQNATTPSKEVVEAHLLLAEILRLSTGDRALVERHLKRAREVARKINNMVQEVRVRIRELRERVRWGERPHMIMKGLKAYLPLLENVKRRTDSDIFLDVVEIAISVGDSEIAKRTLKRLDGISECGKRERIKRAMFWVSLTSRVGSKKELEKRIKVLEKELEGARIPLIVGRAYLELARAYRRLGKKKDTERALKNSRKNLNRLRKNINGGFFQ